MEEGKFLGRLLNETTTVKVAPSTEKLEAATPQTPQEAVEAFVEQLGAINGVDGVAFVIAEQRPAPASLGIEVFAQLIIDDKTSTARFDAITDADARLWKHLGNFGLPFGGLRIFNTSTVSIDEAEQQMRQQWEQDPTTTLGGLFIFDRTQGTKLTPPK